MAWSVRTELLQTTPEKWDGGPPEKTLPFVHRYVHDVCFRPRNCLKIKGRGSDMKLLVWLWLSEISWAGGEGNKPVGCCDFHATRTTQGLQREAQLPGHVVSISIGCAATIAAQQALGSLFLAYRRGLADKRGGFAQRPTSKGGARQSCRQTTCWGAVQIRAHSYLCGFSLQIPCRQSLLNGLNWLFLSRFVFAFFFGKLRISFLIKTDGGRPDWAPCWRGCDIRHISRFAGSLAASQGSRGAASLNPNPGTRVSAQSAPDTASRSAARSVWLVRAESA